MQEYEALNLLDETNRWQDVRYDSDGNPNKSFPYPPKFVRSEAQGELADRIRAAFAEAEELDKQQLDYEPVYLTEKTVYGGYSEYTQENLTYLKVSCGIFEKEFDPNELGYSTSMMSALLSWLDEAERSDEEETAEDETFGLW